MLEQADTAILYYARSFVTVRQSQLRDFVQTLKTPATSRKKVNNFLSLAEFDITYKLINLKV